MTVSSQLDHAKIAARQLLGYSHGQRQKTLRALADAVLRNQSDLLGANSKDLACMDPKDPRYDRLKLTEERLADIAQDLCNVAAFESPLGETLESKTLDNGLELTRLTVPIGVVGVVYEARPNVTFDVFALCFLSGNSCVLKGGSDAAHSNSAIASLIRSVVNDCHNTDSFIQLLPPTRDAVQEMLSAVGTIDVVIPRGSKALIDFVRNNAKVPVIETGAGVVHTYLDASADLEMAKSIIFNAKTRRVSVCNALDTLLVHRTQLNNLPTILSPLAERQVQLFADRETHDALIGSYPKNLLAPAAPQHYGEEFLDYKMSVRCVDGLDDALEHITTHSSRHSEAIISNDPHTVENFLQSVDAAVVYANASTAFTDGAQFGLGAEIGISTQKLPPRGPMSLRDLTTYKWIAKGQGQTRP